jgi:hypothetical protein
MKFYSKSMLTVASVLFTGVFGFLQAQNNGSTVKLHEKLYKHYDKAEIDHFKAVDYRQLNWYMTQSFVVDMTTTICNDCPELNVDTFDVIRYDKVRQDEGRVRITPPGAKHPIFLFSKKEVLTKLQELKYTTPNPLTDTDHDTTIMTCNTSFFDPAGQSANYFTSNIDTIVTFCASTPGSCLQATFTNFQLGSGSCTGLPSDIFIIYDGPDTTSNWIGNYGPLPSNFSPGTITSTTGCLTFQFITSPCTPGGLGWDAIISCATCPIPATPGPSCNNVDFELNSFTGWTGTTGTNQASVWTTGIVPNRQTITTGQTRNGSMR